MARTCLYIYVSAGERARIVAAANAVALTVGGWVRQQALSAAPPCALPLPAPLPAPRPQRPPARRTRTVSTCLSEEQFAALRESACACELTLSTFISEVLLNHKPKARRPIVRSAIVAVHRAGYNLNQLVQLAAGGTILAPDLLSAVAALRQETHSLLDALLTADAAATPEPSE